MPSGTPGSFGTPQRIGTTPRKPEEKPYSIEQDVQGCSGYAVVKVGEGMVPGGCHNTFGEAQAHLAALNAAMQDEKEMHEEHQGPEVVPHQDDMVEGLAQQQEMGLNPRQFTMYDLFETMAEEFGVWDQGSGANGAHYIEENPFAAEGMKCSNCVFYEGGKKCEIVSGNIEPEAICKLWIIREELLGEPKMRSEETTGMKAVDFDEEVKKATKEYKKFKRDGRFYEGNLNRAYKKHCASDLRRLNRELARKIIKDDDSWEYKPYPDTYLGKQYVWNYW
jgi:hypothetical protein